MERHAPVGVLLKYPVDETAVVMKILQTGILILQVVGQRAIIFILEVLIAMIMFMLLEVFIMMIRLIKIGGLRNSTALDQRMLLIGI